MNGETAIDTGETSIMSKSGMPTIHHLARPSIKALNIIVLEAVLIHSLTLRVTGSARYRMRITHSVI